MSAEDNSGNNNPRKRGLGRGLDALFKDVKREEDSFQRKETAQPVQDEAAPRIRRADEIVSDSAAAPVEFKSLPVTGAPRKLPIELLTPGKFQPRKVFEPEALQQLADSIAVHGVIQPLLVRPLTRDAFGHQAYEIVAGERRWRAAQKAKLHDVPVVIQELTDHETLEVALIENLQRQDLGPLEEAEGYQRLMDEFRHTQEALAQRLGKSRSHVANMLRLLKLPPNVRKALQDGTLTYGHARALIGSDRAERIAEEIIKKSLSVRQAEKLVKAEAAGKAAALKKKMPRHFVPRDVDVIALEERLTNHLGLRVTLDGEGAAGTLHIEYKELDQLDDVVKRLLRVPE